MYPSRQLTICLGLGVAATLLAVNARAQEGPGAVLEEVTVTAQKREQNLQDVGTSITAFDGRALSKLGLSDATDLVPYVPGLQFNWFGPSLTVYNLRGVSQNDYGDHQEAPVAVYSDEAYIGAMGALAGSLFDLERVEVLRGPQGTLFGRNATGGLIHYVSARPTDTFTSYLQLTGGQYTAGNRANNLETEGAISGPLSEKLLGRLSFATARRDGLIENRIGPNVNTQNQYAGRLQLLFRPTEKVEGLLKLHLLRNNDEIPGNFSWTAAMPDANGLGQALPPDVNFWGNCAGCDLDGYRNPSSDLFNQAISDPGRFDRTVYGTTGRLKWNLPSGLTLTSVTDYMHMQKDYREHSNPTPVSPIFFETHQTYRQFSQELRLNSDAGPVRWIAGAYYLDRNTRNRQVSIFGGTFTVLPGANAENRYEIPTESAAVFGQAEWDVTSRWTLIGGLRYTHDKISDDYTLFDVPQNSAPVASLIFNETTDPALAARKFNALSGKVEADFRLTDDVLLYASVNRGTKGGGYSAPSFNTSLFGSPPLSASRLAFEPEKLTSYEVGEKWTFLSGAARLNGSLFYYDYEDYQGLTNVNFLNTVGNYQAQIKGGEIELDLAPRKGLSVQLGVSGLAASVEGVPLPSGVIVNRQMPQAPKWSVTSLLRYEWSQFGGLVSAQTDWKYDADQYFTMLNNPDDFEPNHVVGNVRFGYAADRWDFSLFVRNVTDRRYRVFSADASGFGFLQSMYAPPRYYGVTIAYHLH